MARKSDVYASIYNELQTILDNETGLSSSAIDDHTGLLNRTADVAYPFLGFEAFGRPHDRGMRGNVFVDEILTDADDEFAGIRYRRDVVLTVDVGVLVDDGDAVTKDDLATGVVDHFQQFEKRTAGGSPSDLHEDVYDVDGGAFDDESNPARDVRGDRLTYEVSFSRYEDVTTSDSSLAKMDAVNVTIEDDETATDYFVDSVA